MHTNSTTNYDLSQFIETDKPAWLTDYNGDMRTLDTALKGVSDVANGASGSISSLTDRMTAAEGAISTNANDIDALEARADTLEAQAQSTSGTIANIQTEQTAQNMGIEAATELGYNLARPYDSASTYAVGAYVLFQNTLYKCVTAIATGEAFDPTKWLAIKATDEISAGGYTLPIASASQLGGVKVGRGLSIDAAGVLSTSGNIEIIELNTTNNPFSTISMFRMDQYTSFGGQPQNVNLSNPTFHAVRGYLIKLDATTRLLSAFVQISFDEISYNNCFARFLAQMSLNTTITGNVISAMGGCDSGPSINNNLITINTPLENRPQSQFNSKFFNIMFMYKITTE